MGISKSTLLFVLLYFIAGCTNSSNTTSTHSKLSPEDLIGKTLQYSYGESVYHVIFDNASEMHWEAMAGDEQGTNEEETYKIEVVSPGLLFITWGEANGIGVSQVLDFNEGVVYNHLSRGRDITIGQGEIKLLQ